MSMVILPELVLSQYIRNPSAESELSDLIRR